MALTLQYSHSSFLLVVWKLDSGMGILSQIGKGALTYLLWVLDAQMLMEKPGWWWVTQELEQDCRQDEQRLHIMREPSISGPSHEYYYQVVHE